jgi:hypothetical protein
MGTPDYMAPEQAADARQADIRTDIYSLGCTLYDLLTGQPPFPEGTIIQKVMAHHERLPRPLADFRADVPRDLATVLARMMAKNPAERYQTPIEVVRALAAFVKPAVAPWKEAPPDVPVGVADSARTRTAKAASPAASPSMEKELIAIAKEESRRPRPVAARRPAKRRRQPWYVKRPVWLAGAAAGFLLIILAVGVLGGRRTPPATPKATLTLQAEGNNAAVLVIEEGRRVARLDPILVPRIELETGRRYHLELEGAPDGITLSRKTVTLLPGDAVVVKTQRAPPPVDDTAKLAKNYEESGPRAAPSTPEPGKSASQSSAVPIANGKLHIESEEPSVAVVVKRDGKIVYGPTSERTISLRPGNYEIDWAEPQGLLRFSTEKFELTPGGQSVIHIRRVQLAWPARMPAPDLGGIKPLFDDNFSNSKSGFVVKKEQPDKNLTMTLGYARDHYAMDFRMRTPAFGAYVYYVPVPLGAVKDFACQVVGRVSSAATGDWALRFGNEQQKRGTEIALGSKHEIAVWPTHFQIEGQKRPLVALQSPVLKAGNQFNTLLIIVRGRLLEVYVNAVSVSDPITLDQDYTPANLFLATEGSGSALHAEFQRVTVWPAARIPTALARGAVPK